MEITNVSCMIKDGEQHRRAVVTVTFDHQFMVHDIRVVETDTGRLFVAMPSKRTSNGYKDIAHPITQEARDMIDEAVLTAYQETLKSFVAKASEMIDAVDTQAVDTQMADTQAVDTQMADTQAADTQNDMTDTEEL